MSDDEVLAEEGAFFAAEMFKDVKKKRKKAKPAESESEDEDDFDPREFEAFQEAMAAQNEDEDVLETIENAELKGPRMPVNNKAQLELKQAEIATPADFHWVERLDLTCAALDAEVVHDDLKRESAFYGTTLECVKRGIAQLDQLKIPFRRPADFYAEMVKPDSHMKKVREALLYEKNKMDAAAERRRQREQKKYAKQVHAERLKERSKQKKEALEQIKRIKKSAKLGELKDKASDAADLDFDEGERAGRKGTNKGTKKGVDPKAKKSRKRQAKDEKYGRGGPKRHKRDNDAKSAADMSGFSLKKNRQLPKGISDTRKGRAAAKGSAKGRAGPKGSAKGSAKQRPGKARRAQQRGSKK